MSRRAYQGTSCARCDVPHAASSKLCPFCEVFEPAVSLESFGLAMMMVGLYAAWMEADEFSQRVEGENKRLKMKLNAVIDELNAIKRMAGRAA